jgi:benzoylformate decarboxylase
MTPIQAFLRVLRDEGIDRVFGNPGTTELPFLDALDLPYVLGLHEGPVVAPEAQTLVDLPSWERSQSE